MTYRFLEPEEAGRVESIFHALNCEVPKNGRIWVGEENGEIVSFQCMHQVTHLGPVWVAPSHRGKGLWRKMQEALEAVLPEGFGFYQFGTEKNESQLKRMGLSPLGWTVWMKVTK